jgi:hypothetical protein
MAAARLGMPTAAVRLAMRDEGLKAARYEVAALLMAAGYAGAREVLLDGYVDPDLVITPGVFVTRLVQARPRVKEIEQRTVRPRVTSGT